MRLPLVLLLAFVFALVLFAIQGAIWALRSRAVAREQDLRRRITAPAETLSAEEERQIQERIKKRVQGQGSALLNWIDDLNQQAGRPTTPQAVLWQSLGLAVAGVVVMMLLSPGPLAVLGVVPGILPVVLLSSRADKRSRLISAQLPDALDIVGRSLQAGYGLSEALRVAVEESQVPIAVEFGRVYEEHNLGRDFKDCLQNLVLRNPRNFDLRIFVASVLLQRESGGNLVEIVQSIAGTIRARFTFEAKVRALTSESRLSAIILGSLPIFVALIVAFMQPTYLGVLFTNPLGRVLFIFAVVLYLAGVVVMRALQRVDV
ncbi:MAG: type II secretion system F family protein [Deltaproteobacteria bacterium]|nr:type II secretion system F family protein [Deltaproteobacteria bacterium]